MSSKRAKKMVEMAATTDKNKLNVAGSAGIFKLNTNSKIIRKMKQKSFMLNDNGIGDETIANDQILQETFPNETNDDIPHGDSIIKSTEHSNEGKTLDADEINNLEADFDGYDSDKDPEFNPGRLSESSDSDIELMAEQLEANLNNLENVTSKQPSSSRKIQKHNKNFGKAYMSSKGVPMPNRRFTELTSCRNKCESRINIEHQTNLFTKYWALGDYNKRVAFVAGFIQIIPKKTMKLDSTSAKQRRFSCKYFVKIDGHDISICKSCLIATLGETPKFIRNITNKLFMDGAIINTDLRGRHSNARTCSEEVINEIKNHINQFPAYESHYTRRDSSKKYLSADLTLTLMYKLYTESHNKPVSISKYSSVFKEMNLKFKPPKTDVCNTCETLKCKIDVATDAELEKLINEQKKHHDDADRSYKMKELDKSLAKDDKNKMVCTFDLEQCLPTPYLKTSLSFYKRQLWTYNLTVHDCISNSPYCYMWDETIAKRGGNDIASCLFAFLRSIPQNISNVVFYSDSCPGQNKNSFVASMFTLFLQIGSVESIDHKFLTVGHTHMECDVDHSVIERKRKKTTMKIHHPRDWYNFVRGVGNKNTFNVIEMTQEEFYNFSEFSKTKINWRKTDTDGNPFSWKLVRWMRFEKKFGGIKFKTSLDLEEPFRVLKISRRGINSFNLNSLNKCYTDTLPINHEKKKDLLDLLPLLDTNFHEFYKNLPTNKELNYDPDIGPSDVE